MKKLLIILLSTLSITFSCTNLDNVWEELREHEERIEKLEALCGRLNSNVEALQGNDYVTGVAEIVEDGEVVVGSK